MTCAKVPADPMTQARESARLATAALMDLGARAQAIQAAVLRGAPAAEIEAMRQEAQAVAESYLDHTIEAAKAARALLEP